MKKFFGPIPLDLDAALERTGGEMDFLEELIDMFIENFEEKFSELKEAINRKDSVQVQEIAHSLKGSSANLGLTPLQETFYQLEIAGRNQNLSGSGTTIDHLKIQFDELTTYWKNRNRIEQNSFPKNISEPAEKVSVKEISEKIKIDESIIDLIPSYLENRKSDVEKISSALKTEDIPTIETLASRMKGSGLSYGFEKISQFGKQIELSAIENDRDQIRILVKELRLFLENVRYE